MRNIEHPNIVRFYDCFETEDYYIMFMELCSFTLFDLLQKIGTFPNKLAKDIIR